MNLINKSFSYGLFPKCLKDARVSPLFKSGSKINKDNYRSISVLPALSKSLERLMYRRLYNFLEKEKLLTDKQFGFRSKRSTIDALITITEKVRKEEDKFSCILLDLRKAFDTINHERLLLKLNKYGIRGVAGEWFKSYLTDRRQCVEINNVLSDFKNVTCGVPQGSILGPLLFIIFINDLPGISSILDICLFADDTNILYMQKIAYSLLNSEILKIESWMKRNGLSLNVDKTQMMHFSNLSVPVELNGEEIGVSNSVKYLGIYLDKKLNYSYHVQQIVKKLTKHLSVIGRLRHFVSQNVLLRYYNFYMKPLVQYGLIVYGCTSYNQLKPIFLFQKNALRLIFFKNRYFHSQTLFKIAKIKNIYDLYISELSLFSIKSVCGKHSYSRFQYHVCKTASNCHANKKCNLGLLSAT